MDEGLKQRIIGAVVLIIAAVVFLPMLLSGQDETVQVEVDVPEAPVLAPQVIEPVAPAPLPAPAEVPELPVALPDVPGSPPKLLRCPAPAGAVRFHAGRAVPAAHGTGKQAF